MSVEQTTQLLQLILNSVLMSVVCAVLVGGLTIRHGNIRQQLQGFHAADLSAGGESWHGTAITELPSSRLNHLRLQIKRLRYRYQVSRYSVLSAYYALFFSLLSCFVLVLRGLVEWNGLIPVALGLFVIGIATLLVAIGLTLMDWHLSDRALLEEVQKLLGVGSTAYASRSGSRSAPRLRSTPLSNPQNMRVG
jgi:hypothetical protein